MPKMSPADLSAMIAAERANALGGMNASTLVEDRSKALDYYQGDMEADMPAPKYRSKAISSDVSDTIEGMMPYLMDIFASDDTVVKFEPVGPEDEEAAAQETDYVNHVFMQKNPGFMVLYTAIKDALLSKVGTVKIYWNEETKVRKERFFDQPDDMFGVLVMQGKELGYELDEHTETEGPNGEKLHDCTFVKEEPSGCAKAEPIPPEEFLISRQARSIETATYVAHEPHVTEEELLDQGFDEVQIKSLPTKAITQRPEEVARNTVEDWQTNGDTGNNAGRLVDIVENYIRVNYDGTGRPQLYRVPTGGSGGETVILKKGGKPVIEEVEDIPPFACGTPIPMPHRFFGRSLADLVMDIQRIKTALLRALLDNAYMANNQRVAVATQLAGPRTIDDLLQNRPGGIVRTNQPGAIEVLQNQSLGAEILPLIDYVDGTREFRTGVSKLGAGLGADALQNQTAQAVNQAFTAAQARMKMVARILGETLIRNIFSLMHRTIRKYGSKPETVRLRNKWVTVDPREWKERNDLTINVGLGSGSKEAQIMQLQMILGLQTQAMQIGLAGPEHLYHTAEKMLALMGHKNATAFFKEPEPGAQPPPPPEPPQVTVAKIKAQTDQQKAMTDAQLQAVQADREAQIEQEQAHADIQVSAIESQHKMALAEQKHQLEMAKLAAKLEADRQKASMDLQVANATGMQNLALNHAQGVQKLSHAQASGEQNMQFAERKQQLAEKAQKAKKPAKKEMSSDEIAQQLKVISQKLSNKRKKP